LENKEALLSMRVNAKW